jgi:hypothetical protein
VRIPLKFHFIEGWIQGIEHEKASGHGFPQAQNLFERFIRLQEAYNPGNRPQNSGFLATGNGARGRGLGEKTAVARTAGMGFKGAKLTIEPQDSTGD